MNVLNAFVGNGDYFIITNGTHMLAVPDSDAQRHALSTDEVVVEAAAREIAAGRFSKAGLDAISLELRIVSDDDTDGANACEIDLPEAAIRAIAHGMWDDDDGGVDEDAVVADGWVTTWKRLSASDALEYLAGETGPVPVKRSVAARADYSQRFSELAAQCKALDGQLTDDVFTTDPALAGAVALVKAQLQQMLDTAGYAPDANNGPVIREVVRTWEVGDGVGDDLTAEQRKPWRVQAEMTAGGLRMEAWPAHLLKDDAEEGLGVLFEVRKGRPALSIGPCPGADHSLHVVANGPDHIEVVPGTGRRAPVAPSQAYEGVTATVFRNNP